MNAVEVRGLKKDYRINEKKEGLSGAILNLFNPKYKTVNAVCGIDFSIKEGEMVGYIGANGAGKSTTIKMLTGILSPTSGEVFVNGIIPSKNRIKNNMNIGAVFGQRTQLWWDLPVIESLNLIKKIYLLSDIQYEKNLSMFKDILDLNPLLKVPVRQLSLGQKMRCEIAAAFIHDPKIVFLDEPTIGLDIMVKDRIRDFIRILNREKNTTVILTTHDLQDIEEVCKRIIIIDYGKVIYDGSIENIKNQFGKYRNLKFQVKNTSSDIKKELSNIEGIFEYNLDTYEMSVKFDRTKLSATDVMNIVNKKAEILDLTIEEPSIESIVKDLYRK